MKCSDEISIGEYVRTNLGHIGKIIKEYTFKNGEVVYPEPQEWVLDNKYVLNEAGMYQMGEQIVKHSKNIIDLVQKDDYVNGYKVLYVCNEEPCPSGKYVDIDCNKPSEESYFFESEIQSIITKEQIKQIEFRIKE